MQRATNGRTRHDYEALLLDGPLAGSHVRVDQLPDGEPVEVIPIAGDRHGAYVLAGFVGWRGFLPYRWVTREEWAGLRRWLHLGRTAD